MRNIFLFWVFIPMMVLLSSSAHADLMTAVMGGDNSTARLDLDYQSDLLLYPNKRSSDQEPLQFLNVHAFFAPYKTEEWSVFTELKDNSLYTGLHTGIVGNEMIAAPEYLYDQSVSVAALKKSADGSFTSASLELGSASDKPFKNSRDTALSGNLIFGRPPTAMSQWIFIVNYSNNRGYLNNVPIPSFAYIYHPDKKFLAVWGFPFASFTWTEPDVSVYKITLFPTALSAEASFQLQQPFSVYSKVDYRTHSYLNADRVNDSDRLFFEEKRLEVGLRTVLSKNFSIDIFGAFTFDRNLYEAQTLFKAEGPTNRIENDYALGTHLTLKM